ncbi:hypothetical protein EDC36_11437 [Tepidimonas ignava]|uniref:DUF1365 family protein n=1 Tax=Tepidimonas ignava TaxID=114249 RepID=A0A4R3L6Z0_9BURK|nr:DUF1365 domain-containing protein [Tepidimonas ignava]TCS95399.1 hypothetical protein EDC36_11437 [Tepidimonas ignava]TSE20012.1 hypothetical protein Tigna_02041 [Tepidimonas ignava]
MASRPTPPDPVLIGRGWVQHQRLRPQPHRFGYRTWFALLPMHVLPEAAARAGLALNRPGWVAFDERDHGDGRSPAAGGALAWLRELLAAHGIADADGPVWLQTYLRVLGYVFKPVSFWYCHRADGTLRAIVAEVNNTFGQRHCYLLDAPAWGRTLYAPKTMHVSPFARVEGGYAFRFLRTPLDGAPPQRIVARVEYRDAAGALLLTSLSGALQPAQPREAVRLLLRHGWHSAAVMARIHWQALQLWRRGVPWFHTPAAPAVHVTRQQPTLAPWSP